jgi:hypothetical protein
MQDLSALTEEGKLYHEAVRLVLAKPENKGAGPRERDLVTTHRTLEELLGTLSATREENKLLKQRQTGMLWKYSRSVVGTLARFENAVNSMAQASLWPLPEQDTQLTKLQKRN